KPVNIAEREGVHVGDAAKAASNRCDCFASSSSRGVRALGDPNGPASCQEKSSEMNSTMCGFAWAVIPAQTTHKRNSRLFRMRISPLCHALLAVLMLFSLAAAPKPNIIVILADDMGFSDAHCMGSEIDTPNLDKLAANGIRFTQFYNTARCCTTRASLLTGVYPHQADVGHMTGDRTDVEGYRNDLS